MPLGIRLYLDTGLPYDDHRDGFLSLLNAQAPLPWGDVVRGHSGSSALQAFRGALYQVSSGKVSMTREN